MITRTRTPPSGVVECQTQNTPFLERLETSSQGMQSAYSKPHQVVISNKVLKSVLNMVLLC